MPLALQIFLLAVVVTAAGYLMNQLPEIPQFPGRGWLLGRLFGYITLGLVAVDLLTNDQVTDLVKTGARYGLVAIGVLLLVDLWRLCSKLFGKADEDSPPQDLRTRLLKGLQSEVAARLEDSLHEQVSFYLLMRHLLSIVNRRDKDIHISLETV